MNMMAPAFHRCVQRRIIAAVLILPLFAAPALATTIERVVSPGGIEAWLVHEPAVPMIAVDFAFGGGAAQDPAGKAGTANLVASLLDEGAGDLDSKTFHARLERKAIELGFQAERDTLRGTLRTLTENRDEAFDYLRLALTAPRFDADRRRDHPLPDSVQSAPRHDQPDRHCQSALVADRIRRSSLRPSGQRQLGIGADHHRRRSQGLHPAGAGACQPEDRRRRRHRRRSGQSDARPRVRRACRRSPTSSRWRMLRRRGLGAASS